MKTGNGRIKMAMTFDEQESMLLREAAKIVCQGMYYGSEKKDYRRIVMLALLAYCRGVIKAGECPNHPMMAELRAETESEQKMRIAGLLPNQTNNRAALAALSAKNEALAKRLCGLNLDEIAAVQSELELIAAVVRGQSEKIPANAKPFAAEFTARLCAMDDDERAEYAENFEQALADLLEYLENLAKPDGPETAPNLNPAELRYCEAEGIKPADYLKAKSRK
jgi:hypothetical protein